MSTDSQKNFKISLVDAGDGSGDAILAFPDEALAITGWVEGDTLSFVKVGDHIRVTKADDTDLTEDKMLEEGINQMNKTTAHASAAIDEALAFVESSNQRIDLMEKMKSGGSKPPEHPQ